MSFYLRVFSSNSLPGRGRGAALLLRAKHRGLCRAEPTHRNGGSRVEIGSVRLQLLRSKGQTRHFLYARQLDFHLKVENSDIFCLAEEKHSLHELIIRAVRYQRCGSLLHLRSSLSPLLIVCSSPATLT